MFCSLTQEMATTEKKNKKHYRSNINVGCGIPSQTGCSPRYYTHLTTTCFFEAEETVEEDVDDDDDDSRREMLNFGLSGGATSSSLGDEDTIFGMDVTDSSIFCMVRKASFTISSAFS